MFLQWTNPNFAITKFYKKIANFDSFTCKLNFGARFFLIWIKFNFPMKSPVYVLEHQIVHNVK